MAEYAVKKQRLLEAFQANTGMAVGLEKETSNLFRDREGAAKYKLPVRDFDQVLHVDPAEGWVEVEGMTSYQTLVDATLPYGVMPAVVPQLKSITIGGAVSGIGIESSSFKYGLVHETVLEMEILVGDGRIVHCTPDNEHSDLFFGFPNSYGTLGYILKLKVKTVPVKGYVKLNHIQYCEPEAYFEGLAEWCQQEIDFIDGTVFAPNEHYLTLGTFTDRAPYTSDYTFEKIYYRSPRERDTDYLTTHDYLWRWDTDWFWCSKNVGAQNPILRRLFGRSRLNSITYTRIMRWNARWGVTSRLNRLLGWHTESVIQDVDIPIEQAASFLRFFHQEIGIAPIWICPIRRWRSDRQFDLYRLFPDTTYVNFGFWDVLKGRERLPAGYYNRKIERKVSELGGIKSLYSDVYYPPEEFWEIYNRAKYDELKARYDPQGNLEDLYHKCVLRK